MKNSDPSDKIPARCNVGVQNAFKALFGNSKTELDNKNANSIVQHWSNSTGWESITISQAQELANAGWFVVAGWENSSGSGHVAVVVPGTATTQNWDSGRINVPNVMDTGSGRRETSTPINKCFGKDKHSSVVFYKYK